MFGKAIKTAAQAVKKAAPKLQQAKQMATAQRTAAAKKATPKMAQKAPAPQKPMQFLGDALRLKQAASTPQRAQGLGTGMGTGMNKMAGAGVALGKAFGAKKGGAVPSKMGAVKTSAKPDGVATKGKTKGAMIKMAKGGKSC
jgi:hypothetical protein